MKLSDINLNSSRVIAVDTWGKLAMFTRPEYKVERYSYDVPTPSSMRGLLQSIYWHPSFDYEILGIQVYNPIRHMSMTRNELSSMLLSGNAYKAMKQALENGGSAAPLGVSPYMNRQQRSSSFLRDVRYTVYAEVVPLKNSPKPEEPYDLEKIRHIIDRRLGRGSSFRSVHFGLKECTAFFAPHDPKNNPPSAYQGTTVDLGMMFFDSDYQSAKVRPFFYHPFMVDGYIDVPSAREVISHAP